MDNSDIKASGLQDEKMVPVVIEEYRNQVTKRMKDYKYMLLLAMYVDSIFLYFKILKVTSEQNLIWLKMISDWS